MPRNEAGKLNRTNLATERDTALAQRRS
jgi:hypothetical protein